jgi:hypothetical protein
MINNEIGTNVQVKRRRRIWRCCKLDPNHLRWGKCVQAMTSSNSARKNKHHRRHESLSRCHKHFGSPAYTMSAGYFPKREKVGLEDLFRGLVTASHILHHNGILDAYGHISVRSPDNPATFWMPCNISPALISTPDDLVEYNIDDASEVEKNAKPGYLERHIHSEIYKRFPAVNSVVHSHCSDVLPYCISEVPLKATIHTAGFLGE